jgi:hypothetical protein
MQKGVTDCVRVCVCVRSQCCERCRLRVCVHACVCLRGVRWRVRVRVCVYHTQFARVLCVSSCALFATHREGARLAFGAQRNQGSHLRVRACMIQVGLPSNT